MTNFTEYLESKLRQVVADEGAVLTALAEIGAHIKADQRSREDVIWSILELLEGTFFNEFAALGLVKAADLLERLTRPLAWSGVPLLVLGLRLSALKDWSGADRLLHEAADAFESVGRDDQANLAIVCCVDVALSVNDLDQTEQLLERFDPAKSQNDPGTTARYYLYRSYFARRHANIGGALESAKTALAIRKSLNEQQVKNAFVENTDIFALTYGQAARNAGRLELALQQFEDARRLAVDHGNAAGAAYYLSEIGMTWQEAGERERGNAILLTASREAERLGNTTWAERWANVGSGGTVPAESLSPTDRMSRTAISMYDDKVSPAEARAVFLNVIEMAAKEADVEAEVLPRAYLAASYAKEERYFLASVAGIVAADRARRVGNPQRELSILTLLGNIYMQQHRTKQAEQTLLEAAELGEKLRANSATEMAQTVAVALEKVYAMLAFLYVVVSKSGDATVVEPEPDRAFAISQKMRAANLALWLLLNKEFEGGSDAAQGPMRELRAAEIDVESKALDDAANLSAAISRRDEAALTFERLTKIDLPEMRSRVRNFDARKLFSGIAPGTAYIELLALDDLVSIQVFDLRGIRETTDVIWPKTERLALLQEMRDMRNTRAAVRNGASRTEYRDVGAAVRASEDGLATNHTTLNERLLVPMSDAIRAAGVYEHVVVLPHRELSAVAFSPIERAIDGLCVSIAPSALCALMLRERPPLERDATMIAFGDATGSLPGVPRELELVQAGATDPCPSRQVILEGLKSFQVLHIATHGRFDYDNPYKSGIFVNRRQMSESSGRPVSGRELLTVGDILSSAVGSECRLAVLSACYSGLPRLHPANEYTSIPAALLIIGVRGVVGALWAVDDGAAVTLMDAFYRFLRGGASPSRALSKARARLRKINYEEARAVVGPRVRLPARNFPYDDPIHVDAFQYLGVD